MIEHLPPIAIEGHKPSSTGDPDHPMRIATRRAAGLDPGGWTSELRTDVERFFTDLAPEWHTRSTPERTAIVMDALSRGLGAVGAPAGRAIEIGSGIGSYSSLLAQRFAAVLAIDLSLAMLQRAPARPAYRVQADGARLPVRDGGAAAVVLINAFLFPAEVARVLASDGTLVWVNSSGEKTPIHLAPEDLVATLPGEWSGVASRAGEGLWCVLRRSPYLLPITA